MTKFLFLFAIVFIASGFLTVLAANLLPGYAGLAERINLYSLMVSNIVLAFWVFSHGKMSAFLGSWGINGGVTCSILLKQT